MKHFTILLVSTLLLSGCKTQTASEAVTESAINTATALEQSLTPECKTEPIIAQIQAIKTQIQAIESTCKVQTDNMRLQRNKYMWAFFATIAVCAIYFLRKMVL